MVKKDIVSLPDPVLRQRSRRVGVVDEEIRQLAKKMIATTLEWEDRRPHEVGVAMAAVQIGQPISLIVIRNNFSDKRARDFQVLINPEITKREGELGLDTEGCLSVPSIYGEVPRYQKVKIRALDLNGKPIRITATGFLARVIQHEIDHLSGKLFIDRVEQERYFKINKDGKLVPLTKDEIRTHSFLRQ